MVIRFSSELAIPHPLGVKPMGNLFMSPNLKESFEKKSKSLGFFSFLSEDIFIDILSYLPESDLVSLGSTSQYMHAYSSFDELWKELFWQKDGEKKFKTSWKNSLMGVSQITFSDIYSDLLYTPYRTSGMFPSNKWLAIENIERRASISVSTFLNEFEILNKPMILTGYIAEHWPHFPKTMDEILELEKGDSAASYSCGQVSMTLTEFREYMNSGVSRLDESPYFVFDAWAFASSGMKKLYSVPPIFETDLFDLLDPPFRPDNAWLLIGAANSASKWHVDPNATNAWNGVVSGAKRWLLLPPHLGPPPGVEVSSDGFAVKQPLHLRDWFASFYQETVRQHGPSGSRGLVECTCRSGEIVFIPRGWWHCVLNVEPTIAVTQNYAAESSLSHVRQFVKKFPHCVSGIDIEFRPLLGHQLDIAITSKRPDLKITHIEEDVDESGAKKLKKDDEEWSFWGNLGDKSLQYNR